MRNTSIIIVTYNNLEYTKKCIESIRRYTTNNTYEIIVVDNYSSDDTYKWLLKQKNIRLILNKENLGYPLACNQGIKIANKDNDILLLNNDTIVTKNWLNNLKKCLYSNKLIGVVGSVSNNNENIQGVNFTYDNFKTMQKLAKINNISNKEMWEEKVFLIGYCILIKRECFNKVGYLDKNYTPGYVDDNDYSIRVAKAGYKQYLCHDSFIHHYLGSAFRKDWDKFYKILDKNRNYFYDKFKFKTELFDTLDAYSYPFLTNNSSILIINCNIGVSALRIKYLYKSKVTGVEEDYFKRKVASKFIKVYSRLSKIKNKKYDYILIDNKLEFTEYPIEYLKILKKYLTKNGKIIGQFENINSIDHIYNLLNDNWYFNHSKTNYYTRKDFEKIANLAGYSINIYSWYKTLNDYEQELVDKLKVINNFNYEYISFSYSLQLLDK